MTNHTIDSPTSASTLEAADLESHTEDGTHVFAPAGDWRGEAIGALYARIGSLKLPESGAARLDLSGLHIVDSAGAWLIHGLWRKLDSLGVDVTIDGATEDVGAMLDRIAKIEQPSLDSLTRTRPPQWRQVLASVGETTVRASATFAGLLSFLGAVTIALGRTLARPKRLRMTAFLFHIEQTGLNAMGIVGLINFLIGLVLAYMGATQLANFGAEIFAVDLVGIAVLREMGILLTAIIVAGRSGSAFTAQIGAMKAQEEIDAMRTIGVDPLEALVLPRMFALLLTLPALTLFGDLMGLVGGAIMGVIVLDISIPQFMERLRDTITIGTFLVGMSKAPVFAVIIAMVGCYEGLRVGGSAESVGKQTTRSVVESIFLVIVFDAVFAIMYSYLGI